MRRIKNYKLNSDKRN